MEKLKELINFFMALDKKTIISIAVSILVFILCTILIPACTMRDGYLNIAPKVPLTVPTEQNEQQELGSQIKVMEESK